MNYSIKALPETFLIGRNQKMSLSNDQTFQLWKGFAPRIREITNRTNKDRISLKIFPFSNNLGDLTPDTLFDKWAAVPVTDFSQVPRGLQTFTIPEGLYAVFTHRGTANVFEKTLENIFTQWLPNSAFRLDNRPHFEILDENYRVSDPESEETIWIPVIPIES